MFKTILWDFDGVIIDSMHIRNFGFKKVFEGFPASEVEKLLEYHLENGGLSRYNKIRYFFENIRNEEISEEKIREYANTFSEIMRSELVNSDNIIEDSISFIKKSYQKYKFHIVSGSDQNELRFLCKELGIDQYFVSIHGSPVPKIELVSHLLNQYGYNSGETCLIGDSINDYEASIANNIHFIGYNNRSLIDKIQDQFIYIKELSSTVYFNVNS